MIIIRIFANEKKSILTTYQIEVNEATPLGQSIITLLQSAKYAVPSMIKSGKNVN
jgi:hypothetical protein